MPKFMLLYVSDGTGWSRLSPAEAAEAQQAVHKWWGAVRDAGQVVSEGRLGEAENATTVRRRSDGKITVVDGPFIESKEQVGGYAVVDVPDLDAAVEIARTSPMLQAIEIRPIVEQRD
jgi:hypothetical protein